MAAKKLSIVFVATILVMVIAQDCLAFQPRIDDNAKSSYSSYNSKEKFEREKSSNKNYFNYRVEANNVTDDRILVNEPYKSLIQTTARFAMAQSSISKHIDIETAMDIVNDTGFMLSKPSVLSKVAKVTVVILATLMSAAFFFPGAYRFADTAWRNPSKAFNFKFQKYLPNGISEQTIIKLLGSQADDVLQKFGLDSTSCREQTVCQAGELLKCEFPRSSEKVGRFMNDNFPRSKYRENNFVKSFLSGFFDGSCDKYILTSTDKQQNCASSLINSLQSLTGCQLSQKQDTRVEPKQPEYQHLKAAKLE